MTDPQSQFEVPPPGGGGGEVERKGLLSEQIPYPRLSSAGNRKLPLLRALNWVDKTQRANLAQVMNEFVLRKIGAAGNFLCDKSPKVWCSKRTGDTQGTRFEYPWQRLFVFHGHSGPWCPKSVGQY